VEQKKVHFPADDDEPSDLKPPTPSAARAAAPRRVIVTRCPQCKVTFFATAAQLKAASGAVRCGVCQHIFDALEHEEKTPEKDSNTATGAQPLDASQSVSLPAKAQVSPTGELPSPGLSDNKSATVGNPLHVDADINPLPELLTARFGKKKISTLYSAPVFTRSLVAVGILCLALQFVFTFSKQWGQQPHLRSVIVPVCSVIGCQIGELQNIALITSESLSVSAHGSFQDVLSIRLMLTNHAAFAQPFPKLLLRFTDTAGNSVAQRLFEPKEYLAAKFTNHNRFPARQAVRVQFDIMDPGEAAVSYTLDIRK